jgi:hypothetical protein
MFLKTETASFPLFIPAPLACGNVAESLKKANP